MIIIIDQNLLNLKKENILDEIFQSLKKNLNQNSMGSRLNLRLAIMHQNYTYLDASENSI
jgi:hypothetical protein